MRCPGGSIPSASINSTSRASPSPPAQGTGEHWVRGCCFCWRWEQPQNLLYSECLHGSTRLCLARCHRSSQRLLPASRSPLVPQDRSKASEAPSHRTPKPQGGDVPAVPEALCSGRGSSTHPGQGVRNPHSCLHRGRNQHAEANEDLDPEDAYRAQLFSLAALCCCIHGNTITIYIYIIYILLKLHNQCTKNRGALLRHVVGWVFSDFFCGFFSVCVPGRGCGAGQLSPIVPSTWYISCLCENT